MDDAMSGYAASADAEEVFMEKVAEHKRAMYGIAYSYFRNEADALEMLQEATCRAWIKRKSLRDESRFAYWLIRILINCCNDELRRRKRVIPARQAMEEGAVAEMSSDRRLDMERALDAVKPKYRQVLLLKYYRDMTVSDIADLLQKPEGTVKTWLNKGLGQMRDRLKGKGMI